MIQLSLFADPRPILPTFERLREIALRWKIKVTRRDKKDLRPLFIATMKKIGEEADYYFRTNLGVDSPEENRFPIEDFDAYCFFDYYKKATRNLGRRKRL
jgi:hypothetical protein